MTKLLTLLLFCFQKSVYTVQSKLNKVCIPLSDQDGENDAFEKSMPIFSSTGDLK
jgi:hypothetical protein